MPAVTPEPVARSPLVEVHGVSKVFGRGRHRVSALEDVNLTISTGEVITVLGPSGCGKSTMLSIIAGLESPTAGRLQYDGRPLTGQNTACGMVFQKDLLLDWKTSLGNVLCQFELRGIKARPHVERAEQLLRDTGIAAFADMYPRQLSGGMRQRVAICRALVHDPPLLLMDEPFGSLDAMTREQMNLDIARLAEELKQTVVLVTHSVDEAVFLADRVIVMSARPGRIVGEVRVDVPRPRRAWPTDDDRFGGALEQARALLSEHGAGARR